MINIKNKDQLMVPGIESWEGILSPEKIRILKKSWAEIFRNNILPQIPMDKIIKLYSKSTGRPTKELYALVGAVILQEIFDLTDEETVVKMAFNLEWHYALDCFSDKDQIISEKTLWTMRAHVVKSGLYNEIYDFFTDEMISRLGVDVSKQWLDSVHDHQYMARLGRMRVAITAIVKFLKDLKKNKLDTYNKVINAKINSEYLEKDFDSLFSSIKPSERESSLQKIGEDIYSIICLMENNKKISRMKTYKTLLTVFYEHYDVEENVVSVKKNY